MSGFFISLSLATLPRLPTCSLGHLRLRFSRLDAERNVIVINNGHRDFVYASRGKSLKLRYLVRLYAKELVMHNFVGLHADQLLERMVELSLRTEEHL
jgi:hypothetical protein